MKARFTLAFLSIGFRLAAVNMQPGIGERLCNNLALMCSFLLLGMMVSGIGKKKRG